MHHLFIRRRLLYPHGQLAHSLTHGNFLLYLDRSNFPPPSGSWSRLWDVFSNATIPRPNELIPLPCVHASLPVTLKGLLQDYWATQTGPISPTMWASTPVLLGERKGVKCHVLALHERKGLARGDGRKGWPREKMHKIFPITSGDNLLNRAAS